MTIKSVFGGGLLSTSLMACALFATPAAKAQMAPPDQAAYQDPNQYQGQQQGPPPSTDAAPGIQTAQAPPPIPQYDQPEIPGDGYLWTPGYWAWGPGGYYWVDGAWVDPPYVGALWTPGYWGWGFGFYHWYPGYWGRHIGYYGGINYGFGYFGVGFYGGYWNGGHFWYNRAYGHFGESFHGYGYNRAYAGFNGRPGGASFTSHATLAGGAAYNHSTLNGNSAGRGYAGAQQSYNRGQATQSYNRTQSYSGGSRGYSAPASHGYSGGAAHSSGGGHSGGGHR